MNGLFLVAVEYISLVLIFKNFEISILNKIYFRI